MTSKQRMTLALAGGTPDRVPVCPGLSEGVPVRRSGLKYIEFFLKEKVPLWKARIEEQDVLDFWKSQPFDLQLRTWEGNCDLCFLKSHDKKVRIVQDRPDLAGWWLAKEAASEEPFRRTSKPYAAIVEEARRLPLVRIGGALDDDLGDCLCTG